MCPEWLPWPDVEPNAEPLGLDHELLDKGTGQVGHITIPEVVLDLLSPLAPPASGCTGLGDYAGPFTGRPNHGTCLGEKLGFESLRGGGVQMDTSFCFPKMQPRHEPLSSW